MQLKKNIFTSLLISIGFILHQTIPGAFLGMKFDLMLSMLFISLLINPSFKNFILTSLIGGILTALTTNFPNGQIPNLVDKIVTCFIIFIIIRIFIKFSQNKIFILLLSFIGTFLSGVIFLSIALLISGLKVKLVVFIFSVVFPTAIVNAFLTVFLYQIIFLAMKASKVDFAK